MKKHAIIPIFIPHKGCPHNCGFCNQKVITSRTEPVTEEDVNFIIETHLSTILNRGIETVECAFYGGSFTGIPISEQSAYLAIAKGYKDRGKIDKVHISTRPDYINEAILDNLKKYGTDIIELGAQSFDDGVLEQSNRGHSANDVRKSAMLIKSYGFTLGIQLMTGLPGSTYEKDMYSAGETVKLAPDIARIYPTIILEDTELFRLSQTGHFNQMSEKEAIRRSKDMYLTLSQHGINVIRIGLKNTFGTYHPSFRQLVESEAAKELIEKKLTELFDKKLKKCVNFVVTIKSNQKSFSNLIGNKQSNKLYFKKEYPEITIEYAINEKLVDGEYQVEKREV